ncbi:protein TolA [Gilliamella sp. wkB108]|nr:protein TolA [Gilliamella apicola]
MLAMSDKLNLKTKLKLSLPMIISITLHGLLIILLGYKLMQDSELNYGDINGQSIDAIMIDTSAMKGIQPTEEPPKEQPTEQPIQQPLKDLEEDLTKITEIQKQEEAKKELQRQEEAKKKEEAKKAKKAEELKKQKQVDKILGGLTSGTPNTSSGSSASRKGVSNGELGKYNTLVKNAISNKFSNPNKLYSGRHCVLEIQIASDGFLIDVKSKGGDEALCREAISATKATVIPKPSSSIYDEVKTMIIDFQPK